MEALSQAADANLFVESRAFLSIGTFLSVKTGVYLNVSVVSRLNTPEAYYSPNL